MMKKVISVLLSIVVIAGVFSACQSEKGESSATVLDTVNFTYDGAYSFEDVTVRAYEDLCKAVIHGEGEVRINPSVFDDTMQLFYTSFPLNALVNNIVPTSGAYKITYKNAETAHSDTLAFIEKIHGVYPNTEESDAVKLVNIYNKVASSIKPSDNSGISCYETVMTGEGTSFSYSNMFEYVLQQHGIKAYHILCEDASGTAKAISAAELDGKLYYFDVFAEFESNRGTLLNFFGMNSDELEKLGYKNMIYTNRMQAQKAEDNRFSALEGCIKWELDEEKLLITDKNGKVVQVAL